MKSTKLETGPVSDGSLKAHCGAGDYVRNQLNLGFTTDPVSDDHLNAYCGTGDYVRNQLILDFASEWIEHDFLPTSSI